jgi:flagellar protein FlgJ
MPDPLSLPKVPLNLSEIVYTQDHIQRTLQLKKRQSADRTDPELRTACAKMESLFIHYLLKEMRATINKSGFISGGRAEEIYTSMLDSEIADDVSVRGGIGLADVLLRQLANRPSEAEGQGSNF